MSTLATLLLDSVILIILLEVLGRDDGPEFPKLALTCFGLAAANCLGRWVLWWFFGPLVVLPLFVFNAVVLMAVCRLRIKQALVAAALFFVFRTVCGAVVQWWF